MAQVSPRKLDRKTLEQISNLFFAAMTSKRVSRKKQQKFFEELLTQTEKVMLAKRLTAIALLGRGISPYQVGKTLKLSEATTQKLLTKIELGKFDHVLLTHASERTSAVWNYIENLISPLPHYGKNFMRHLEDTY